MLNGSHWNTQFRNNSYLSVIDVSGTTAMKPDSWLLELVESAVEAIRLFKLLDRNQRNTFLACFLGWALDAFDFFY